MSKRVLSLSFLLGLFLTGCLTCEYKIYKITLNKDNSGTMEIVYKNIFSDVSDDDEDIEAKAKSDYDELLTKYLAGNEIESSYPNAKVVKKELFEENGTLCGRIVLEFQKPEDVKLYRYDKNSPWMFKYSSDESFVSSNGEKKFEDYNIVFWPKKHKDVFTLTTSITKPQGKDLSLLKFWKK